ncbi:MAG TPA: ubiquinone biosynthesis regulatory protein kinase UbiB [Methyloprofundus sp.]|uniref:ubiquinone biosynthesis regulatory protein kinase UbiB n=1 Tax=Methyloprofundus sp. TaxID=2020875 RepID=UPI0017F30DE8|nr:ubiquinone biosynthesis regulatory protein kinase UbiB [Methyloprofundus sp.]HIG65481.1 ubiquinone biosynthesis regulatory protein kinase UbiB [Methyloprofundus sp.]HIL78715.1 ubiquinone biosynthesis regulatory protein kinase UbiB [Methylococcales bacterium]
MKHPKLILRVIHINWVFITHGLDDLILNTHLFRPLRFLGVFSPNFWRKKDLAERGVRIRRTLEDLGPIYVKFGQALSTRKDILPDDIADELVKLQDKVPPFSDQLAREVIEQELGMSIDTAFAEFSPSPLASASVAQVHTAVLHTGEQVVVKVLRPDVEKWIHSDIGLLYELAYFAEKFWDDAKRMHAKEIVAEFEKTLLDELDLVREAGNAAKLRRNFLNSESIYIPEIYWEFTRKKVLVMERIHGIPVGNIDELRDNNADFKLLAERGVEIFFTQVFRDNFFHADMHPGNIFVELPGKYIAVDFGIVGTLSTSDQRYLAENFLAFFNQDYRRVAEMHIASGWVPANTRVEEFESAIRSVCEPIFDKPLKDISFGLLLLRLFQTARRFDMQVQPQLVLLQKTLLNIEGLGRQLYPDLDLWQTAKPFLEDWFKERLSPKTKIKQAIKKFPELAEKFPEIPALLFQVLDDAAHTSERANRQTQQLEKMREQMKDSQKTTAYTLLASAALISAAIIWS